MTSSVFISITFLPKTFIDRFLSDLLLELAGSALTSTKDFPFTLIETFSSLSLLLPCMSISINPPAIEIFGFLGLPEFSFFSIDLKSSSDVSQSQTGVPLIT